MGELLPQHEPEHLPILGTQPLYRVTELLVARRDLAGGWAGAGLLGHPPMQPKLTQIGPASPCDTPKCDPVQPQQLLLPSRDIIKPHKPNPVRTVQNDERRA